MVRVVVTCPFCGAEHSVTVWEADFEAWQNGALAQNAFPYLSAEEREQLISQLCPECQERVFG